VKEAYKQKKKPMKDVTHHLLVELEKQVNANDGILSLWPSDNADDVMQSVSLESLQIPDPYPGKRKTLWIRFARAGDGERKTQSFPVSANGEIESLQSLLMDMDAAQAERAVVPPMANLTKEEFIACFLSTPLLTEPLARISSTEFTLRRQLALSLDVNIKQGDIGESSLSNPQRAVLLELWVGSHDASALFAGEAWLPPLEALSATMSDTAL